MPARPVARAPGTRQPAQAHALAQPAMSALGRSTIGPLDVMPRT
jgi:hypothetical protein